MPESNSEAILREVYLECCQLPGPPWRHDAWLLDATKGTGRLVTVTQRYEVPLA